MSEDNRVPKNEEAFKRCMNALPFYVNGTLPENERSWVEAFLFEHPQGEALLSWHLNLQEHAQKTHALHLAAIPENIGLKRLKSKLAHDRSQTCSKSWITSLQEWWASFSSSQWLPTAFAATFGIMVIQAVVLALWSSSPSTSTSNQVAILDNTSDVTGTLTRSTLSVTQKDPHRSYLKIRFQPDATEEDLRFAVIKAGAQIVHGPNASGEYIVEVATSDASKSQEAFKKNTKVVKVVLGTTSSEPHKVEP
ncbi:MAG: hypothetical protein V4525_16435 [Pseudomonadota bacterium]